MQKLPTLLVFTGLIFLVGAVVFGWHLFPTTIRNKILEKVRLENGTDTWESWSNIEVPVFFNIYLFNLTNAESVKNGDLPIFDELGPYVYEEKRRKFDISIDEEKDTVKYRQRVFYHFRDELSDGSEDDTVITLNIPLYGVSRKAVNASGLRRFFLNSYVLRFKEQAFVRKTVKQLLFGGYIHPMLSELASLAGREILPNGTFGLMYGKNGTDDGLFEVFSGIKYPSEFGKVHSWNGQTSLKWWSGEYCNMINGSDGAIFPPFVERSRILRIFSPDLCRSLHLTYDRDEEYFGIPVYRFSTPKELLEDPRFNEDNRCFCPNEHECAKASAIQLSVCRGGAPVVASTPYFLDGDEEYIKKSGLTPVRADHETFIELEPNTGLVIRASKRIQINIDLKPTSSIDKFARMPRMLFPIMYGDENVVIPDDKADSLRMKLLLPLEIVGVGKLVVLGLSCILICAGITVYIVRARKKKVFI